MTHKPDQHRALLDEQGRAYADLQESRRLVEIAEEVLQLARSTADDALGRYARATNATRAHIASTGGRCDVW